MGHYYSLESSKIDLLFDGGQVRSETDLMVLDFFCECNKYRIYSQIFKSNQKYFYDLAVILELGVVGWCKDVG